MKRWKNSENSVSYHSMCRGSKRGRGNPELVELLGENVIGIDVNSMKPLDNLCHPVSVIRDAEELAADAFHAEHAFLMWEDYLRCRAWFCQSRSKKEGD